MGIAGSIKVDMAPVRSIMERLGVTAHGDVQRFHTANVRRRIQKYMPYRSGATIKLMIVQSPVDEPFIHVGAPQARMMYCGKPKVVSVRDLQYDKTKNPEAGPHWDRRLIAAEGAVMRQELQDYVNRRAG